MALWTCCRRGGHMFDRNKSLQDLEGNDWDARTRISWAIYAGGDGFTFAGAGVLTCCSGRSDGVSEREWLAQAVTEAEWLGCCSIEDMPKNLDYCFGRCGVLFAAACCRSVWHLLPDDPGRTIVLTAEDYADTFA